MRRALALLALLACLLPCAAWADDIASALRDSRWADADAMAAQSPDPVARKLVQYLRLLTPGAGHPAEIASFMADNPAWPNQPLAGPPLVGSAWRAEPDDRAVLDICLHQPAREVPSMLRCAAADANAGRAPDASEAARRAWAGGITDPAAEAAFLRQWGRR